MRKIISAGLLLLLTVCTASAQDVRSMEEKEAEYWNVVLKRARKIVEGMKIADSAKANRVTLLIAQQYKNLNTIYERRDEALKAAKAAGSDKNTEVISSIQDAATKSVDSLHPIYLSRLASELNAEDIEKVKDGMTYGVLPLTYSGYIDMIPRLTEAQRKQILDYLTEAREHAMDAESSDRKHAWFGKYKGRINNYLSKEGYDMKTESRQWEERIRQKKAQ